MIKIVTIFGTRPEAIKMAPVIKKISAYPCLKNITVITAQHRGMLDQVLELFGIQPDYDLDLMHENQTLPMLHSRILSKLPMILQKEKPRLMLVQGDTTTAFASALAGYYEKIKIGHIEAGLRSGNKYSPFPEEYHRKLIDVLADFHFAPTVTAKMNLLREGIPAKNIIVTGNTVIDTLLNFIDSKERHLIPGLEKVDWHKRIIILTSHRRENFGRKIKEIFFAIQDAIRKFDDIELIFPVHANPQIRTIAYEIWQNQPNVNLIPPLQYKLFISLLQKAYLIITDSGGIQEEASVLGIPVFLIRDNTDRPELINLGAARLIGTSYHKIYDSLSEFLAGASLPVKTAKNNYLYGDGNAAQRIVDGILYFFHRKNRPEDFHSQDLIAYNITR